MRKDYFIKKLSKEYAEKQMVTFKTKDYWLAIENNILKGKWSVTFFNYYDTKEEMMQSFSKAVKKANILCASIDFRVVPPERKPSEERRKEKIRHREFKKIKAGYYRRKGEAIAKPEA